jgi:hypothetical protein
LIDGARADATQFVALTQVEGLEHAICGRIVDTLAQGVDQQGGLVLIGYAVPRCPTLSIPTRYRLLSPEV